MASVGSIVGGAFRLVRDRPVYIAIWALTYFIVAGAIGLAFAFAFTGGLGLGNPTAMMSPPQFSGGIFLAALLVYCAYLLLIMVLMNAVFRCVLRPSEGGFAAMRLGMDELRMLGLLVLWVVAYIIALIISWLGLMLVMMLFGLILRDVPAALFGVVILSTLAFYGAWIWVHVRLSLLFPLTFHRRRIALDEAWSLTRGRFWTLFGSYFIIWVILFAAMLALLFATGFGSWMVSMFQAGRDPERAQQAVAAFMAQQAQVTLVARIALALVWAAVLAVTFALWPGALAVATRQLLLENGEVTDEDAEETAAIFE